MGGIFWRFANHLDRRLLEPVDTDYERDSVFFKCSGLYASLHCCL